MARWWHRLAASAAETLHSRFSYDSGVDWIAEALGGSPMGQQRSQSARAAE